MSHPITNAHGERRRQGPIEASYVLPIRRAAGQERQDTELTDYVSWLATLLEVVVVDGSAEKLPDVHPWRRDPRIVYLAPRWRLPNGKVAGVLTGVAKASHERLVVADDDVRWSHEQLADAISLLDRADLVRPQNVFSPLPWHARWDTARSLVNRAFGHDYPGTFAIRRSVLLGAGGYCGAVLFENLQLIRTVVAAGGVVLTADDLIVTRRPPTTRRFLEQRVRQAYDSTAQPARLAAELAAAPLIWAVGRYLGLHGLAALAAGVIMLAERGRRRHGGSRGYGSSAALWAPCWVVERAFCSWWAQAARLLGGGVSYAGGRLGTAATPAGRSLPGNCRRHLCPCAEARLALHALRQEPAA